MRTKRTRGRSLPDARRLWSVLVIAFGIVLFLSSCASAEETAEEAADEASSTADAVVEEAVAADEEAAEETQSATDGESGPDVVLAPTQSGRLIQRDASLSIEVDDLSAAVTEVSELVVGGDSYLASENTDERSSQLVFKVPAEEFDDVLSELPAIGQLRSQQVTSNDRTDTIVDLRSQLETAETSLERTRGFFEQATSVEDLTRVEAEVAQREATVASIKAQLENAERSVALSTITVSLFLGDDLPVELDEEPGAGLGDALSSGLSSVSTFLFGLFLVGAWLLPWTPIALVIFFAGRWLRRRAVKRRAAKREAANREAAQHVAAQPGVPQPGVPQPGVHQPGVHQPGVTQHIVAQPGVHQPGAAQPGVTQPGVTQPGVTQPGVTQPGVAQHGVPQPGPTRAGRSSEPPADDSNSSDGADIGNDGDTGNDADTGNDGDASA